MSTDLLTILSKLREGERATVYCYRVHGGEMCQFRAHLVVVNGVWWRDGDWELAETLGRRSPDD